jgi:hypothetical protein
MAYIGILLVAILISFIIVRIGGFALELTGIEPDIARFQALSAFSGTGFTTREAERVVGNRVRRRIVTILIVLGNAGTVTVIATLVLSFSQVTGYGYFFIRLGIILAGIFGLYQLILRTGVGRRVPGWLQRPVMNRVLKGAPSVEEIFRAEKEWGVSLIIVKEGSRSIGLSVADIGAEGDIEVLGIDRVDAYLSRPNWDERVVQGDRLLVYANRKAVKRFAD